MQNFHNLFGFQPTSGMIQPGQPQQQPQPQAQPHPQQLYQAQPNRPRKEVVPILNPNANSKELYCVEGAVMKEYNPLKREWAQSVIKVQIERKPFAEGGMRCAYRMKITEGMDVHGRDRIYVLKLSKDPKENVRQYYKDVETQMEARKWAQEFNKSGAPKQVHFIEAMVVILTDRPTKPTCTMEKYVEGDYVKYNDNWAWCDDKRNTPQAFSHWSWEASGNKVLICDLQGVGDCWTDPQIHTIDGRGFGKGNAGLQGIRQFLHKHKCNAICRALRLQSVTGRVKAQDEGTKWGAQLQRKRQRHDPQTSAEPKDAGAGEAGAVGVGLTIDGGMAQGVLLPLIVVAVKAGGPAAMSGRVQRGDFIVQIGDRPVQGAAVSEVKKLLRGPPGSAVTLHLQRGVRTHAVDLLRGACPLNSKRHRPSPDAPSPLPEKTAHQVFKEVINGAGKDTDADTVQFQAVHAAVPPKQPKAKMLPHPAPFEAAREDVEASLRRREERKQILRRLDRFPDPAAPSGSGSGSGGGGEQRADKENVMMRNGNQQQQQQPNPVVPDLFGMIAKNMALPARQAPGPDRDPASAAVPAPAPPLFL